MKNLIRKIEKYFNQELDFSNISSTTIDGNENLLSGAITYLMHKNIDSEVSLSLLQNIIDNGVNVNHKIEESNSPLIKVFLYQWKNSEFKAKVIEILLSGGADQNIPGHNLLEYATAKECKLLLAYGADLERIADNRSQTAIFDCYCLDKLSVLIDSGANINHSNKKGKTCLACYYKKSEYVRFLLDNGINTESFLNDSDYTEEQKKTVNAMIAQRDNEQLKTVFGNKLESKGIIRI
ncbi:hypothetical protein [Enterobacter hormaechei]|uniref:hypothetical protein n=1 Tax=Enterobacter hormaechei TaxID=158836 RepID=UPI0036D46B00